MLWINKLSEMEDEKIFNDGAQQEPDKSSASVNIDGNDGIDHNIPEPVDGTTKRNPIFKLFKGVFILLCVLIIAVGLFLFVIYGVPGLKELTPRNPKEITGNKELQKDPEYKKQIGLLSKDVQRLTVKFNAYTSGQSYIVVNTTENRFYLYKNKQLVREGSCSTGSYKKLQTAGGKSWTFKTPRGKFTIQNKRTHPAWHRPDWSFIEEGSPIPPKDSPLRWETGVLGDYAMDLGDSYMIHGTIYKRFLGMPVTHGCVRLNDEDLEVVFNTLNIGSKVYIF
jgi:lipoprotein-anchoring transpeptidase ErfK/SrfK